VLRVRGPHSKERRSGPIDLLALGGQRYLVAVRGEAKWLGNIRVAGEGELVLGRTSAPIAMKELAAPDEAEILHAYLQPWGAEVSAFFGEAKDASPDEDPQRIAP
jgi:hypothetical protein